MNRRYLVTTLIVLIVLCCVSLGRLAGDGAHEVLIGFKLVLFGILIGMRIERLAKMPDGPPRSPHD